MRFLKNYIIFNIKGENISRLISSIFKNKIECRNLVNKGDTLEGICKKSQWNSLKYQCEILDLEYSYEENKSIFLLINKISKRKGLIVGFITGFIIISFLSNTFLRLRVKCDDENIKSIIENYIISYGIEYGSFIPEIDIYSLELDMMKDIEEISWAGIYITGGTLNVDLVLNVPKPQYNQKRLPSDLVATKSGEIVSAEIYSGKLVVPVGSGVHKGQTIVSGEVDLSEDLTALRRSQGKVYAKVLYKESFFCPFDNTEKVVSDKKSENRYLSFFSYDIPLFLNETKGMYQYKNSYKPVYFFDIELPIGLKYESCYKYDYINTTFNINEATDEVYRLSENFKDNFLKDTEILEEKENITICDDGVRLDKTFLVIENIAEEKEILIK